MFWSFFFPNSVSQPLPDPLKKGDDYVTLVSQPYKFPVVVGLTEPRPISTSEGISQRIANEYYAAALDEYQKECRDEYREKDQYRRNMVLWMMGDYVPVIQYFKDSYPLNLGHCYQDWVSRLEEQKHPYHSLKDLWFRAAIYHGMNGHNAMSIRCMERSIRNAIHMKDYCYAALAYKQLMKVTQVIYKKIYYFHLLPYSLSLLLVEYVDSPDKILDRLQQYSENRKLPSSFIEDFPVLVSFCRLLVYYHSCDKKDTVLLKSLRKELVTKLENIEKRYTSKAIKTENDSVLITLLSIAQYTFGHIV